MRRSLWIGAACALLLACALSLRLFAQTAGAPRESKPVFRAESSLVLIPFHVTKDSGPVQTLTASDVEVLEDGEPRPISVFERGDQRPVEIALLFDARGRQGAAIPAEALVLNAQTLAEWPSVRLAVYAADEMLMPLCPLTRDSGPLRSAVRRAAGLAREARRRFDNPNSHPGLSRPPRGSLSLLPTHPDWFSRYGDCCINAAAMGAARLAAAWPGDATRAVLIFSDGQLCSTAAPEEAVAVARQLGIPLFPVLFEDVEYYRWYVNSSPHAARVRKAMRDGFLQLGEESGGLSFTPKSSGAEFTRELLGSVMGTLGSEYLAGFRPEPTQAEPRSHFVEVRLRSERLGKISGGSRVVVH